MRPLLRAAAAVALACAAAPATAAPARPVVTDGFTFSGLAGSQVVVRLAREVGPPGVRQQGPEVRLSASKGDVAGLAILSRKHYVTAVRALPGFVCGRNDCGEGYDTDADTNVAQGARLPKGEYLLVLVGAPGARVTATVPSSTGRTPPAIRASGQAAPVAARTTDTGTGQQAYGTWSRMQEHHRALAGVVHVASLQYGGSVSYSLVCPGHARSGSAALKNDRPGPVPLGWAWTPMYTTHVAFGESREVETELTASWQGRVDAVDASQRGVAVYVPLVVR